MPAGQRLEHIDKQVPKYALISLGALACSLALLIVLIENAETLGRFGMLQQVYYLVLVPMGLTSAGFLFGVLRSSATYVGQFWGGTLRISGAVVGAALVIYGGYYFIPKATTFPLTVYVHGPGGPQYLVLHNPGTVKLELGPDLRTAPIQEGGQAFFPAIPSDFRGQQIQAWVESDDYDSPNPTATLTGTTLELEVEKKAKNFKLAGTVVSSFGKALSGVRIAVPEFHAETETNNDGWFELQIIADKERAVDLVAQKQGFETIRLSPTLGNSAMSFSLDRSP